ncbi:FAD-dependent monooxygenase [Streptomyces sp. N2-109]|uniref:FAD-dependent monooxygenase n=1 Tax=Streptomyces gossypii TaxID=2883101 RepID=A0ABT2JKL3_9ACTN|nr:FAD-dependent monooxygenase [Streptomyces gossypii]MCT2588412.1 FAD-dependent monooxygenase [Streptomyces gossypii]
MSSHTRTALVIGGGIAGPIVAMALGKAGIEATVYEAYRSRADGIGGGLSIAPNGLNALEVIGAAAVVRGVGTSMRGTVLESGSGEPLGGFGVPPGLPAPQFVWRGDLARALHLEAARRGIRTVHGKELVGVAESGEGVSARFADGSQAAADVLVGADGIRSSVRPLIDPAAPQPRYAGLLGFAASLRETGLAPTQGKLHVSYGERASFGYLAHQDSSGGWFVNLPHPEPMTLAQARQVDPGEWLGRLREAFTQDRSPALDMLRRTEAADLLITGPLETMPTVPTWSRGRMVLVGDAVHAASPSSGQGASLAIESGVQLARALRDLPHQEAFAAYEGLRRARVERVIAAATRTNHSKANPGTAAKPVQPEDMDWQFDYLVDWDAPVAGGAHAGTAGA